MSTSNKDFAMEESPPVHWEAVLMPHRSLPPQGFLILMLILGAVSFVSGVVFVSIGAWPVFGFFGIDVVLIYYAFRLNYRDGRAREILRLAGDDFVVEKIGFSGTTRQWRSQAFWLKVQLTETSADSVRLYVSSHGRSIAVCSFLGAEETRRVAAELTLALERWRGRAA